MEQQVIGGTPGAKVFPLASGISKLLQGPVMGLNYFPSTRRKTARAQSSGDCLLVSMVSSACSGAS